MDWTEEELEHSHNKTKTWCTDLSEPRKVFCVIMQTYTIGPSNVRVYDLAILLLNLIFILFLLSKFVPTIRKLRLTWPLFSILYCLIFLIPLVCIIRDILAMVLGHGHLTAKITHYILRGIILITEMSVVIFGLTIKYYIDSAFKLAITMIAIVVFASMFTTTQLLMDVLNVYEPLVCRTHDLFTHGGMLFVFTSSSIFAIAYLSIYCLYLFKLYKRWNLPSKLSFYRYALFLSFVNIVQATGSMLWFYGTRHQVMGHVGVCLVVVTSLVYLITFAPVVYWIFLSNYFRMTKVPQSKNSTSVEKSDTVINTEDELKTPARRWRWSWSWSLKPTRSVSVPTSYGSQESSRLINKSTPSSVDNSYSSTSSNEST